MVQASIKIPSELFATAESSRFEGELDVGELAIGPDTYRFAGPVSWSVDVTNTGSALLVMGTASGTGTVPCSRCLEDVAYGFDGDIEGYYLIGGAEAEGDGDPDAEWGEDEFAVLPDDHIIDLEPLVRAALIVDAPQMPLCRDDCAGLCPLCGANLNDGECGCDDDGRADAFGREASPFAVLANYQFD